MSLKRCSKCGDDFDCNSSGTECWCQGYNIEVNRLIELKNSYTDCLCENCLKLYDKKHSSDMIDKE